MQLSCCRFTNLKLTLFYEVFVKLVNFYTMYTTEIANNLRRYKVKELIFKYKIFKLLSTTECGFHFWFYY